MDFESIVTPGTGAILYSRRYSVTELPQNLRAAAAASALRLSSLDQAKRTYVSDLEDDPRPASSELYRAAYRAARAHTLEAGERLKTNSKVALSLGTYAASVALQRAESGFMGAHLMYQLGLNFEGDAIARQVLEQIAWSLAVAGLEQPDSIRKVKAHRSITGLKATIPWAGDLYGELSATTHAGLSQHRTAFTARDDVQGVVLLAWSRLAESAANLLLLADAWGVVWELTQVDHMKKFSSLHSKKNPTVRAKRPILKLAKSLVSEIDVAEASERAAYVPANDRPDL